MQASLEFTERKRSRTHSIGMYLEGLRTRFYTGKRDLFHWPHSLQLQEQIHSNRVGKKEKWHGALTFFFEQEQIRLSVGRKPPVLLDSSPLVWVIFGRREFLARLTMYLQPSNRRGATFGSHLPREWI